MGLYLEVATDSAVATYWTIADVSIGRQSGKMHGAAMFVGYVDEQHYRDHRKPLADAKYTMRVKTDQGLTDAWTLADWYNFALANDAFFAGATPALNPPLQRVWLPEELRQEALSRLDLIVTARLDALGANALGDAHAAKQKVMAAARSLSPISQDDLAASAAGEALSTWVDDLHKRAADVRTKIEGLSSEALATYDVEDEAWPDFYVAA